MFTFIRSSNPKSHLILATRSLKRDASLIDPTKLRNIGVVAHINAGKTTTTERLLFHGGSTSIVGDVDAGNTITDYLVQERDRGITITSAAVSFDWKQHQVNLIDTPGHVDFTFEVERSLAVLDGAVTILDGSAGVEAQTETVWNQASKYKIPNVIFLNKCDKPAADHNMCLSDLRRFLNINAHLIQLPVNISDANKPSLIDLVNKNLITWHDPGSNNGSTFTAQSLDDLKLDQKYIQEAERERERLINALTDLDDDLANHVLECDTIGKVSGNHIDSALRRATLDCTLSPVLVGSSFKYVGVQQLMDAMVMYLPSPVDRRKQLHSLMGLSEVVARKPNNDNCFFIFKVTHDKRLGPLTFVRVCNGTLTSLQKMRNHSTDEIEQAKKIYRVFANELNEITTPIGRDDIVAVSGIKTAKTGHLLVDQKFPLDEEGRETDMPFKVLNNHILVPEINNMEPVYFCSIEPSSASEQLKLERALECLAREDPTFIYEIDHKGSITIRGMGKLHIEVVRDRIQSEYGIKPWLGPLQISYRETIDGSTEEELSVERTISGTKSVVRVKLGIESVPGLGVWTKKKLKIASDNPETDLSKLRHAHRKAIEVGILSSLSHGPSLGYPMIDCKITLLDFQANYKCSLPIISSTTSQCLMAAIGKCNPVVLEPIMLLEVSCPQEFNGSVMGDLARRRGVVLQTTPRLNGTIQLRSHTPLVSLTRYSEFLRTCTSGRGTFSMELHHYAPMSSADLQNVQMM